MKKTWIIIFIVILLLHLGGLGLFLFSQKNETTNKNEPIEPSIPPTLVPESGLTTPSVRKFPKKKQHASIPTPHTGTSKPKQRHYTRPSTTTKSLKPVIPGRFHSYNYSGAVKGDIPGIRGSREATAGILVNPATGRVLWCKNPKKAIPIASMTKMMTALIAFETIRAGKATFNEPIRVTKAAAGIGGSDIWLDPRETFQLGDLLKAMLVKSANDAAYLVAQRMGGGSASAFVKKMNKRAKELGLSRARFHNPHGLPEKKLGENYESVEELAFLASILVRYPEVLKLTSIKIDYLPRKIGKNKRTQLVNTNKLVRTGCTGVDGMKTGYTRKSGFCITVTCKRDNRRLIAVMTGFHSSKKRNAFAKKLLDWGYSHGVTPIF